ncbi:hypothetical protein MYSTI_06413 [Myxococcus stipitatus DSM 14675]|uniref:Uncharacterized protein n=1 Tax=Myxococcus stipitatus (strain DSM 14675 / JCM 12634 / Mx s8) TaxID=1278073 RepID=L7UFG9_MYXSD|nr:hypothetical protein MYSTI_06413 [Myxococcus stipitatus DSM 14675]
MAMVVGGVGALAVERWLGGCQRPVMGMVVEDSLALGARGSGGAWQWMRGEWWLERLSAPGDGDGGEGLAGVGGEGRRRWMWIGGGWGGCRRPVMGMVVEGSLGMGARGAGGAWWWRAGSRPQELREGM